MLAAPVPILAAGPVLAASTAELTIRMLVGLAVVVGLLAVLSRVTRRVLDGRAGARPAISIRHQQRLDRNASVTLLSAGERTLLVGTAGQSIVLLAEGDDLTVSTPAGGGTARPTRRTGDKTGAVKRAGGVKRAGAEKGAGAGSDGPGTTIDVRARKPANPIRALQNRTVRRR